MIDALAARSVKRLNRTIQITDAGINPGSGVGNHRNGINRESIGVPVIAIGVPTVVDAATIVSDTMSSLIWGNDAGGALKTDRTFLKCAGGVRETCAFPGTAFAVPECDVCDTKGH